jgi:hypothetical protein
MADYAGTLEVFKVYKAFPDIKIDQSEWTQDPHDPLRYWGIMRVSGTHTGDLNLHSTVVTPTGKRMIVGPQANSITFDEQGKVKYLPSGYVTDYHDSEGQTGEYGLVFAILKSIGVPIPGTFSRSSSALCSMCLLCCATLHVHVCVQRNSRCNCLHASSVQKSRAQQLPQGVS